MPEVQPVVAGNGKSGSTVSTRTPLAGRDKPDSFFRDRHCVMSQGHDAGPAESRNLPFLMDEP